MHVYAPMRRNPKSMQRSLAPQGYPQVRVYVVGHCLSPPFQDMVRPRRAYAQPECTTMVGRVRNEFGRA